MTDNFVRFVYFRSKIWLNWNLKLCFCATNLLTILHSNLHYILSLYLKPSWFPFSPSFLRFSSAPKLWKCASIFLEAELRLRPAKKGLKWWWVNKMRWVNEYVMREKLCVCDPISHSAQTARSKLQSVRCLYLTFQKSQNFFSIWNKTELERLQAKPHRVN